MSTQGSGASRGGGDDFHNEDAFLAEDELGLYVVCDGASRAPGGEVAAALAVASVQEFLAQAGSESGLSDDSSRPRFAARALRFALETVRQASEQSRDLEGMATTVTMLLAQHGRGTIAHLGDSRAYLIRSGRAHLLTRDHELADSLAGDADEPVVDAFAIDLEPMDTLVLCTDGAEQVVPDPTIVRAAGDLAPAVLASRIVSAANRRNPEADATVVVVRVRSSADTSWLDISLPSGGDRVAHTRAPSRESG